VTDEPRIDLASPANASVLRFLGVEQPLQARTSLPAECNWMSLGTHPDLVEYLWRLPGTEPSVYGCVINERSYPLLVSPQSRVIIGLAGGTSTLALRLPEPELGSALAVPGYGRTYRYPSGPVHAAEIGDDWALVRPYAAENAAWCSVALAHAESLGASPS
jgi:hypothetical protein